MNATNPESVIYSGDPCLRSQAAVGVSSAR